MIEPLVRPVSEAIDGLVGAMTAAHMLEEWGVGREAFQPLAQSRCPLVKK